MIIKRLLVFVIVLLATMLGNAQVTNPATTGMVAPVASGAGAPTMFLTCNAAATNLSFWNTVTEQMSVCDGTIWTNLPALSGTQTFTGIVTTGNTCRVTSVITLSTSATTICSWIIPANAVLAWQCSIPYTITAGTLPTFALGMNAAQAPVSETAYGFIVTSNGGGFVSGSMTSTAAGLINILTGGTVTNSTFQATTFGVIKGSATSGTFSITGTLTGTVPAGTVPVGGVCTLL